VDAIPPADNDSPLPTSDAIDRACSRFEADWQSALAGGRRPIIEEYLGAVPEAEREQLVRELVILDAWFRRRIGELPQADDYQARFPFLSPEWLERLRGGQAAVAQEIVTQAQRRLDRPEPARDTVTPSPGIVASPGSISVPGYQVLGELGRGGMGIVYKALQVRANRVVALKVLLHAEYAGRDEFRRFRTEAEALGRLQHPHIVQIYEVGEHNGLPYFSLEFCAGGSLADKLDGTPWLLDKAAALVEVLARAVHAAHEAQLIHRDLKPQNVLLTEDGTPKVTDFGLVKKLDESALTQSGAIIGTPAYMAPEQASGRSGKVGPTTDVHALGAILYELLTGRPPFTAADLMEIVAQVVSEEAVPVRRLRPEAPRDLETICMKCLAKEQANRYPTAEALANDLRCYLAGEPISARRRRLAERTSRWIRRRSAVIAWVLLVAVVAAAGVIGSLAGRRDGRDTAVSANERTRPEAGYAVGSECDGKLIFVGIAVKPGEEIPPEKVIETYRYYLAVRCKPGEPGEVLFNHRPLAQYREWRPDDVPQPGSVEVAPQKLRIRAFEGGERVEGNQLLGMINPESAVSDLRLQLADLDLAHQKVNTAEAAEKIVKERLDNYTRIEKQAGGRQVISGDDILRAKQEYEKANGEAREAITALASAQAKVIKAAVRLRMHECRATRAGVIATVDHQAGEIVKAGDRLLWVRPEGR
jgi:hypothetical protein